MKHAEGTISCSAAQEFCVMEQSICCWNVKGRWQNLCSVAKRRLGQKTRGATEERNAGCGEWLCHLYREWLLSELTTDISRKHKQTIWHTVWNDGSLDSIVVGFKECCISNSMNGRWKMVKNIHLFVVECWQWLVNWVMMCILGYSSYSNVFTVMFI
jgi:hypothetical protein